MHREELPCGWGMRGTAYRDDSSLPHSLLATFHHVPVARRPPLVPCSLGSHRSLPAPPLPHTPLQEGDGKVLSPAQSAASGFVAACIGPTLNNPFDVVKTRM